MDNRTVEHHVSAGGVVFREVESGVEVLLCGTIANGLWGLPKGTPEAGEGLRATAMREVAEETGVQVEILEKIGSIQYWFTRIQDNTRCHKTVHHYLMSPVGGDPSLHDHEYDVVQWFTVDDAYASLTYENEVNMVRQAVAMITKSGGRKGGARAS